ncbi:MAG: (Fe-S)-binding protein [Methanobacterium sp.]
MNKSLIMPHVAAITRNISEFGNSYGITTTHDENKQENMETVLFRGCTSTHKTPEILEAAEKLLKHKGIKYDVISNETCCGNILFNLGRRSSGFETVRKNIEKFKAAGVKRIITICPGCYNAFHKYYSGQDGFNLEIILAIDLLNGLTITGNDFEIQDPCHAKEKAYSLRMMVQSRNYESVSPCCGAGGGVMAHDRSLAKLKARKAVDNSPGKIVTYCPFCYLNLKSVNPDKIFDIYMLLDNHLSTVQCLL